MNLKSVQEEAVSILRRSALCDSDRHIPVSAPLGELGLGLDSLAMVGFIIALEKRFGIAFPDTIWTERDQLSLQYLTEAIVAMGGQDGRKPGEMQRAPSGSITREGRGQEKGRELVAAARRLAGRAAHLFYDREVLYIMEVELSSSRPPACRASLDLEFREAVPSDAPALDGFWPRRLARRKRRIFTERLAREYVCLAALHRGKIVGIDWITVTGDDDPYTGLRIAVRPGSCYGLDLGEHEMFRGRGVGLALLDFSLAHSAARGYRRQVTCVSERNLPMLSAAVQIFGFRKIGRIRATRILRRATSSWEVEATSGSGGVLEV